MLVWKKFVYFACIVVGLSISTNIATWLVANLHQQHAKANTMTMLEMYENQLLLSDDANCSSSNYFNFAKDEMSCRQVMPGRLYFNNAQNADLVNFKRIVLVVSISKPQHFEVIPKIYRLYHDIFFKIVYCVTESRELGKFRNGTYLPLVNFSIVEFFHKVTYPTGETFYNCLPLSLDLATNLRQKARIGEVDGFLHASDDLVLNLWNFKTFIVNPHSNWILSPIYVYDVNQMTKCKGSTWRNDIDCKENEPWAALRRYQSALKKALKETYECCPGFIQQLANSTKGYQRVYNSYADMFYVTSQDLLENEIIFKIFAKHRVYMELAVGTILYGITTPPSRLQALSRAGQQGPVGRAMTVTQAFSPATFFFHPFKMAAIHLNSSTTDRQCLYCELANVFDNIRQYDHDR